MIGDFRFLHCQLPIADFVIVERKIQLELSPAWQTVFEGRKLEMKTMNRLPNNTKLAIGNWQSAI